MIKNMAYLNVGMGMVNYIMNIIIFMVRDMIYANIGIAMVNYNL